MAVIVSLTLAGSASAGISLPVGEDPVDQVVETASGLADDAKDEGMLIAGAGISTLTDEADQLLGSMPDDLHCSDGVVEDIGTDGLTGDNPPQNRGWAECDDTEAGADQEPEAPSQDEPETPTVPGIFDEIDDVLGVLSGAAEEGSEEAKQTSAGLLRAIWGPIQGAGEEAGRLFQDAYGSATQAVGQTTKTLWVTIAQAGAMAGHLADEATSVADRALQWLTGLVPDLMGSEDGEDNAGAAEGSLGTRSAATSAPGSPGLAMGMVLAGGVGLALAGLVALRRLLGLGGLALLSRIPSSQIMKNGTRNAIFEIVRSDPGVSLNEIVDRMGLSRNAVAYHLAVFESEKLMSSVKDGKYRRYFLNGGRYVNGAKDVVAAIKNDKTLDVIRYIAQHPGVIQKDVCSAVGTSPSATSWHIRRLERVGLVQKERVANMVQYKPGPNLAKYDLSEFGLHGEADTPSTRSEVSLPAAAVPA